MLAGSDGNWSSNASMLRGTEALPSPSGAPFVYRGGAFLHGLLGIFNLKQVPVRGENGDRPVVTHDSGETTKNTDRSRE